MKRPYPVTPRKRQPSGPQLAGLGIALFAVVVAGGLYGPRLLAKVRTQLAVSAHNAPAPIAVTFFPDCRAAHAVGIYSIQRNAAGYRPELDRDGDGLACEPYIGR